MPWLIAMKKNTDCVGLRRPKPRATFNTSSISSCLALTSTRFWILMLMHRLKTVRTLSVMSETLLTKTQSGELIKGKLYEHIPIDSLKEQLQQRKKLRTNIFEKVCIFLCHGSHTEHLIVNNAYESLCWFSMSAVFSVC